MSLADTMNGPDWVIYIVTAFLIIISIVLLSGHGSWLIAGYNTASKEEKEKYDEKKLCRGTGLGMAFIAVLCLVACLFEKQLPAEFAMVMLGLILADIIVMIIIGNTICKK